MVSVWGHLKLMNLFFLLPVGKALDATVLSGGSGGTVSQTDPASTYDTTVGIRFNTDGTVEKGVSLDGAAISWSSAGNWIDPVGEITGTEEVRFTNLVINLGPGDWTTEAAPDDTFIGITETRTWLSNKTAAGDRDFDCDFEVQDSGLDTGSSSYSFIIDNVI